MNGAKNATSARSIRVRCGTSRRKWWAMKIWTRMAYGAATPNMARFGCPPQYRSIGLLTTTATGPGSHLGAGRGWTTPLGAMRHFIMDAGPTLGDRGAGCQGRLV